MISILWIFLASISPYNLTITTCIFLVLPKMPMTVSASTSVWMLLSVLSTRWFIFIIFGNAIQIGYLVFNVSRVNPSHGRGKGWCYSVITTIYFIIPLFSLLRYKLSVETELMSFSSSRPTPLLISCVISVSSLLNGMTITVFTPKN